MSWNGTVRCGNCCQKGHNRRGCPDLKERMEKRLAADPDDWSAKRYFDKKKGAKVRKCSFCKEQGHNRATCPNLAKAKTEWTSANAKYRQEVLDHLTTNGIGLGSLIELPETYVGGKIGYLRDALGIVTGIHWNSINVDEWGSGSPHVLVVKACGDANATLNAPIPVGPSNVMKWSDRNSGLEAIKSPCSGSYTVPPSGWTSGTVAKNKFKDLMDGERWGEEYDYDKGEYIQDTCRVVLHAKKFEAYCEKQKKENE